MSEKGNSQPLVVTDFKGIRNDRGRSFISTDYLFNIINFNFDDQIGANTILYPSVVKNFALSKNIDGITSFTYVDSNENIINEPICITNGTIYRNFLSNQISTIKTGLQLGVCQFAMFNNLLYITNGKDYPLIYDGTYIWEMGAPKATASGQIGNPSGTYYYAITFVTGAGEEYIGTVSNTITVTNEQINLDIPLGYTGTTSRKIYRTSNGGTTLKLVATIANNTASTYVDNTADGSLGADIIAVNNECPKPYFIEISLGKIIGCVSDLYPMRVWVTDGVSDVWDLAEYSSTSAGGSDNTAIVGMKADYSKIIIGTSKNIFVLDVSDSDPVIGLTRSNVGVMNGYSMARVPAADDFTGGVMFVSTSNDIRIFNGNFSEAPLPTSLDNLKTDLYSQPIYQSLIFALKNSPNMGAAYFSQKYHLIIGSTIYIFDIRNEAWSTYIIKTDSYSPEYSVFGIFNNYLYVGQLGSAIIEKMYSDVLYRDEPVTCQLETGKILISKDVKYVKDLSLFYISNDRLTMDVEVILDDDMNSAETYTINMGSGAYSPSFFSSNYYENNRDSAGNTVMGEDYKVIHIDKDIRWMTIKITSTDPIYFRGYQINFNQEEEMM